MPTISVFNPRRTYDEDRPDNMMESDRDFVENNMDLVIDFLEGQEEIASIKRGVPFYG